MKNSRWRRATTGHEYSECARSRPRAANSARRAGLSSRSASARRHPSLVALADDHAGVGDDVGNFAAVAGEHRHAAGEGLDQHASELLAPSRRGLTGREQKVHRIEMFGHAVMGNAADNSHPVAMTGGPLL